MQCQIEALWANGAPYELIKNTAVIVVYNNNNTHTNNNLKNVIIINIIYYFLQSRKPEPLKVKPTENISVEEQGENIYYCD